MQIHNLTLPTYLSTPVTNSFIKSSHLTFPEGEDAVGEHGGDQYRGQGAPEHPQERQDRPRLLDDPGSEGIGIARHGYTSTYFVNAEHLTLYIDNRTVFKYGIQTVASYTVRSVPPNEGKDGSLISIGWGGIT